MDDLDGRFWSKVDQRGPDDCWNWKAALSNGYGIFYTGERLVGAHRYAYVYKNKKSIPDKIMICHHCDNPRCCNPNHLFEGTALDNVHDMISKGRSVIAIGGNSEALRIGVENLRRKLLALDSIIAYYHPNKSKEVTVNYRRRALISDIPKGPAYAKHYT